MADVLPNYEVEQQRLRAQIAAQKATIEQQRLAILEMQDRTRRHQDNIDAALKAIAALEQQLQSLIDEHGVLTGEDRRDGR